MNYFQTGGAGKWLILAIVGGLETVFAAGVWYMVGVGLAPALGLAAAEILAWIVSPMIALFGIMLFVFGEQLKKMILEYESVHGESVYAKDNEDDPDIYYNKRSWTGLVTALKWGVFLMDSAGITYRLLETDATLFGRVLLCIFFELLALAPWGVGIILHMVANRPVVSIRSDVAYLRDVTDAQAEVKELTENLKKGRRAPRQIAAQREQPRIDSPKHMARFQPQADEASQNGHSTRSNATMN